MEVRWSLPTAEDLERICGRIERDNPEAASRVARTVYEGGAHQQPLGRRRELVFSSLPYIAVYQVTEQAVEISRIFHGAQDWP